MREFAFKSALELRNGLLKKEFSAVEVVSASIEAMERTEPVLNAFVTRTPELALEAARACDMAQANNEPLGPLHGLPISIKDLIPVGGVRHTSGSLITKDNIAEFDAPVVERLRKAGACIIGKTTTSEFGCKAVGDSPLTGITRNPWNTGKTTGGSSAGAAASVAAGVTPFAIGTDGGGSARIPASFCGIFGFKGQFGRAPVYPTAATPTLAHIGPMARTVRDAALLMGAIAGFDGRDPGSVSAPIPDFLAACDVPVAGMRIAWSPTLGYGRTLPEVAEITEAAAKAFQALGCQVEQVDDIFDKDPVELMQAEYYAGVGTRLNNYLVNSRERFDPAVAGSLDHAMEQRIDDYYNKVFARYALRERLRRFFEQYDLILCPTLPVAAFDTGLNHPPELPERDMVSWVSYTYPFNLTGQPAASIPCGFTKEGLPVGLQIVGRTNCETDVFRAASAFEAIQPWSQHQPQLPSI
ncbi:amidase [Paenibacillus abyssi]|uniref:Amidase n=1 Tax=Paenibacillus abyssi TaxID=1340531 RepID=A0A917FUK4_9BACL|nr:amidase [Paenibacillus abyssi]GGG03957.1 amidase [Paenibacillus abyssi]